MSVLEIGKKLVHLCKQSKNLEAIESLYAHDITSVEAFAMNGAPEVKGIEAVKAKSKWWGENHEVHSSTVTGPFPHGDKFAVYFKYDVTQKTSGKRFAMEEVALYFVKGDKIIREEFFYPGI